LPPETLKLFNFYLKNKTIINLLNYKIMRKIFLFLFAAVLSIGTAMAQTTHDVYAEGVTVEEAQWSINLYGSWNDQAVTVMLWQDNTQGFGTYAANEETGYDATIGVKELTPTTTGSYLDMGDGTFTFSATMTDGTDIYEVTLKGAIGASSTPETGEMEAKDEVYFTLQDGEWTIDAMADDYSWMLALAVTLDDMTGEYTATGEYTYYTDIENDETATEEVSGTGLLYFDDFSGCQVFRGTLTTESGEIYPTLYASSLTLMTNELMTGASWVGDLAGVDYYEVLMMAADYSWELDLHARNCTGANGTYTIDVVNEEEGAYSTFMGSTIVTGELNIDGGMYDAYVYTKDAEGNDAMYINATGLKLASVETVINIDDATVIEDLSQYGSSWSMKGEVEIEGTTYPVTVEISDEVDLTVPSAIVSLSVTVEEFGYADGEATLTIGAGKMAVAGTLENEYAGVKFVFDISGDLPACPNIRLQAGNNAALLAAVDGKQVNVTVGRNFEAGDGFYTLCVPFDMPASVIGKAYQIASIKAYGAGAGVDVNFTEVTTILAGQPYLIEPAADTYGFTVNNVEIDNSTPAAVTVSGEGVSITMQGKYSRDAKTNGLYWVGNDGYLYNDDVWPTALCAYFNISTPSGIAPRMRVVAGENETTGVEDIFSTDAPVKAIVNGQLVIIRGGEMFNVQGQLVK
jgi:hypothetical protein